MSSVEELNFLLIFLNVELVLILFKLGNIRLERACNLTQWFQQKNVAPLSIWWLITQLLLVLLKLLAKVTKLCLYTLRFNFVVGIWFATLQSFFVYIWANICFFGVFLGSRTFILFAIIIVFTRFTVAFFSWVWNKLALDFVMVLENHFSKFSLFVLFFELTKFFHLIFD